MDTQSLSALVEVQRSIATGEPDVDRVMHLIAECARNMANATGIAIALLKADRLVYRAGSGSAVACVGRQLTAVLNISARNEARSEILRVENAQTDARIEAAICRQFGARSLLILPIIREHVVAGVLEVLFSEPHTFQDQEVSKYRLLAGLVEEAMFRDFQLGQKKTLATQPATVPRAIVEITSRVQKFRGDARSAPGPARKPWISQVCGAVPAVAGELSGLSPPAKAATTITQLGKRALLDKLRWNLPATAVVIALVVASWIAYDHRTASPLDGSLLRSNTAGQQAPPELAEPLPANRPSKAQIPGGVREDTKAASSAFKRVRVGQNEVDYIAKDVTIRRFTPKPGPPQVRASDKQVNIGEDVIVRYFAYKPGVVPQTRPVSAAEQSVERSLPVSK